MSKAICKEVLRAEVRGALCGCLPIKGWSTIIIALRVRDDIKLTSCYEGIRRLNGGECHALSILSLYSTTRS